MKCHQCNKPAIVEYPNGMAFCLDCNFKFQQTLDLQNATLERQINYLNDEIDSTFGIGPTGARFPTRNPTVFTGNINFKPITLTGSVVGSINQGTINGLNINLSNISIGNPELATKLKDFSEAIVNDKKLNDSNKNESIENVKFLSEQITNPNRNKSVIKSVVNSISKIIEVSADLVTLWSVLSPYFLK